MNEEKIIANILKSPKKRKEALEYLKPEYFKNHEYSNIFKVVQRIDSEEGIKKYSPELFMDFAQKYEVPVDMVIVSQAKSFEAYDPSEWGYVMSNLIEDYRSSFISDFCLKVHGKMLNGELSSVKGIGLIKDYLDKVSVESVENNLISSNDLLQATIKRIRDRASSGGLSGADTGYKQLNELFDGWQKGDLIIMAGRPAMGKTAMAIQKAISTVKNKGKAIFFSLEMPKEQIMMRVVSAESKIKVGNIKRGKLHAYEWDKLESKTGWLSNSNFWVDDRSGLTVDQIRSTIRKSNKNNDLDLVVIDYLQLIKPSSNYKGNRNNEVGEITRTLKVIAKEEGVTIVLLSQLSRAVEQRDGKIPQLSDLRDSGEIEQDADIITFCYRPEYYGIMQDADGNSTVGLFMYLVKKNRNGELKNLEFNCDLEIQKIWEGEDKDDYVEPSVHDFPINNNPLNL